MDEALKILLIVGGVTVAVLFIVMKWQQEKKRTAALRRMAQSVGFRMFENRDAEHHQTYAHFSPFQDGNSRYAYNRMFGRIAFDGHDLEITMGDFTYTTGSGDDSTTHRLSYLIVELPWPTPAVLIRREHMFDRIVGAFGFDDIDFESEQFSRKFFVKSDDKRFAYDVIDPRMMQFLLAEPAPEIEISRGSVCLTTGKERWEPKKFRRMLGWSERFLGQWPSHVKKMLQDRRPSIRAAE